MYGVKVFAIIIAVCLSYESFAINSYTCGIDNSNTSSVNEGEADIETYPWLGVLFYPMGVNKEMVMTTIVLISHQVALAAALDIDRYPKTDFRSLSRVVLGRNCSGPYIKVLDYNYHPDFSRTTYNTLAMIQLDTLPVWRHLNLRSICPPPNQLKNALSVYAMTLTDDCTSSMVRIYKMEYVDPSECKEFYRRANLDMESMWPTHVACARATRGGHCVWRSGAVLVMRDHDQWRLLGFGVNGPGCEAPARFLDYGMYHPWVKKSLSKIGRPAITRLGPNHIIVRRSLNKLQRFGECDKEETQAELFNDYSSIKLKPFDVRKNVITYNLTLFSNVEYSCVSLKVSGKNSKSATPRVLLRRVCTNPYPPCYDYNILQINFITEIYFIGDVIYELKAYGKEIKFIDTYQFRTYVHKLFYGKNMTIRRVPGRRYTVGFYNTVRPSLDVLVEQTGARSAIMEMTKIIDG